ncbi:MAG TPA: DUF2203 domain-containing protein [Thermoplasmata archaeon]|nr:DUF2203 domain-containing protein [Thermoplasmata archaeon]
MGGPADVRLHPDATVRLFTEEEANALVPQLEEIFLRLDPKLARLRELRELIEDSEAYYGEGLGGAPGTDREAYARHLQEQADLDRSVREEIDAVLALGCDVKDLHRGLVDFPARIGMEIAYLCWQRGEARIGWWHTLSGGFAGRRALAPQTER